MKNIKNISKFITLLIIAICFSNCDENTDQFIVSATNPVTLAELTITDIELDGTNLNNPAMTLNWTEADYGQQVSVNYTVEFSADQAFTTPIAGGGVTGNNTITFSVNELNSAVGNAGLPAFNWNIIYIRVVSDLGAQDGLPVASNVISANVYPFFNYVFDDYYIVGNATAPGWENNNNNPALFRDASNPDLYTYTAYFTKGAGGDGEGRFKVLETKGLWQPQWGTTHPDGSDPIETGGEIAGNPGTQGSDPGRFGIEVSGNYKFTINFSTNTYSMEPYMASAVASTTSLSIQGTSVDSSVAMTQSSFDSNIFYANSVLLLTGEIQFRTDNGDTWGGSTEFSGVATSGGSIPVVVEDNYDVWFNALTGDYILIPLNL